MQTSIIPVSQEGSNTLYAVYGFRVNDLSKFTKALDKAVNGNTYIYYKTKPRMSLASEGVDIVMHDPHNHDCSWVKNPTLFHTNTEAYRVALQYAHVYQVKVVVEDSENVPYTFSFDLETQVEWVKKCFEYLKIYEGLSCLRYKNEFIITSGPILYVPNNRVTALPKICNHLETNACHPKIS